MKTKKHEYYKVELIDLKNIDKLSLAEIVQYEKFKFKHLGYLVLYFKLSKNSHWLQLGFATPEKLKETIGEKQYSKFCQGKREFIITKPPKY